jgi:hypothetical protein
MIIKIIITKEMVIKIFFLKLLSLDFKNNIRKNINQNEYKNSDNPMPLRALTM